MGKVSTLCFFSFLYGLQRFLIRLVVVVFIATKKGVMLFR